MHEDEVFSTKNFSEFGLTEIEKGGVNKAWKDVSGGVPGSDCSAVGLECGGDLMGSPVWYNEAIVDMCCVGMGQWGHRWTGGGVMAHPGACLY